VRKGETIAVAQAISLVEKNGEGKEELLDMLFPYSSEALLLGITGPPGSGKSSIVDRLIALERTRGHRVGVLAVDPSSPFTGGALLGDRVRMQRHAGDPGVFIRSMATRGYLGGVSPATSDAAKICAAAGYDTVIIETIGVGQSEVEVVELADIILLVLVPGAGDEVQIMKAGIMEIGDYLVVNKCDREGAERLKTEIEYVLRLGNAERDAGVLLTSAKTGEGIDELHERISDRVKSMKESGNLDARRAARLKMELRKILHQKLHEMLESHLEIDDRIDAWIDMLVQGKSVPYRLIQSKIEEFKEGVR
jgi:LAO/AO transport system kinase